MEQIGGIVAGLLILIVLLALTLLAYFKLKRRYADKKYTVEISIAVVVLLVSIGIKLAIIIPGIIDKSEVVKGIAGIFGAIYQGFSGMTFDGLMEVKEGTLACLYYGSSVYAALVIISIITAKTNYEIYSYVLLRLKECRRDIYVFTDLTEDTLRLAKSIQTQYTRYKTVGKRIKKQTCRQIYQKLKTEIEKYLAVWYKEQAAALHSFKNSFVSLNNKKLPFFLKLKQLKKILEKEKEIISAEVADAKKSGDSQTYCLRKDQSWDISELLLVFKDLSNPPQSKKCKIVFAGNSLDSFNNKNELCKEVIAHSFLYWSYSNGGKCNKSLAKRLHLNNRNYDVYTRHFAIFAFASDKGIPKEEENSAQVFTDMELRKNNPDKLRIEYFVLTKRDIYFEAYKRKFEEVCGEKDIGVRSRIRIVNE
ncbi:MAG: hypothetical protein EOM23_08740, partial [Candidatus Moranbacteria bacterium]|nr:hypothetical protein [Candidatus Moranbacteria bacterium]